MAESTDHSRSTFASILPDLSLIGVAVIWGMNIPIMKVALGLLDNVYVFNALRLPVSAFVLLGFAMRERRQGILPHASVRFSQIAVYSLAVSVMYQLVFLVGMDHTTPGNAALILATVPMWTAILAWVFIGERLRGISWCGMFVALTGTIVVAFQSNSISADSTLIFGNLMMCLSALLWAGGTVYSKPLLEKISPLQLAAFASLLGLPAHVAVACFASDSGGSNHALASPLLWIIVLFSGTMSSGLAQPMWHFGVRKAGASHAAIVQNLVPLVAILAAWLMFGDAPSGAQLIGGALILGGLFVMRLGRKAS